MTTVRHLRSLFHCRTRLIPLLATLLAAPPFLSADAQSDSLSRSWNQPVRPFRIAGNIYYVGASDVTSFLITTESGHILLDGGLPETARSSWRASARSGSGRRT